VYAASAVFSDPARLRGTGKKPAANRASGYSILSANSTINANSSAAAKVIGAASSIVNQSAVFG
jgi:hypothetical protein